MKVVAASDAAAFRDLLGASWDVSDEIVAGVAEILATIRRGGDAAIVECARRFDDANFDLSRLRVAIPMLERGRNLVSPEVAAALERAKERITRFHERQRQPDIGYVEEDGTRYALARVPLQSVAVYAAPPAAAASVLMGAVPARIAGVPRIVVLSPPGPDGVAPAVLFACALCAVDELYAIGGVAAIGAAAIGTDSIARVDKIVGRAGIHTTEAKRQVFGRCDIDTLAGPLEMLVVADEGASSEYVVGELLAAAEVPGVTRLAVLSESRSLLEAVAQLLDTLDLRTLERHEFVNVGIETHCRLIEASNRDELLAVINRIAPAYLSLQVRDPSLYLDRIRAAGTIFIGDMTPLASGEYLAGASSVAPTAGTARFASSLSLLDFSRSFAIVENTAERIADDAGQIAALAEYDGLPHRAQTARMRNGT